MCVSFTPQLIISSHHNAPASLAPLEHRLQFPTPFNEASCSNVLFLPVVKRKLDIVCGPRPTDSVGLRLDEVLSYMKLAGAFKKLHRKVSQRSEQKQDRGRRQKK